MAIPKKYSKINFKPPKPVRDSAKKGLELRKKFKRGGLTSQVAGKLGIGSGIVRATNLSSGKDISPKTVKRIHNYFSRHASDKKPGWSNPKNPTNGYIAWMLWGGNPGRAWADKILREIEKADSKIKKNK